MSRHAWEPDVFALSCTRCNLPQEHPLHDPSPPDSSSPVAPRGLTEIDLDVIAQLTGGGRPHAAKTAALILERGKLFGSPLAYVIASIRNEPEKYRWYRGNPRRDQECREHPGEWADRCRPCAIDARLRAGARPRGPRRSSRR